MAGTIIVDTLQSGDGATVRPLTQISKGQLFRIADASDVVLGTCASGGTRVGGSFTANIPTNGIIRVTVPQAQFAFTAANAATLGLGIEVNGVVYFVQSFNQYQSRTSYMPQTLMSFSTAGAASAIIRGSVLQYNNGIANTVILELDVATIGCATGSQTCYVRFGHTAEATANDALTVKGTLLPTRVSVEILGV